MFIDVVVSLGFFGKNGKQGQCILKHVVWVFTCFFSTASTFVCHFYPSWFKISIGTAGVGFSVKTIDSSTDVRPSCSFSDDTKKFCILETIQFVGFAATGKLIQKALKMETIKKTRFRSVLQGPTNPPRFSRRPSDASSS